MITDIDEARLLLGTAAVLPLRDAAQLLPGRDTVVRKWLADRGLVHQVGGADVVVWGEVLDALKAQASTDGEAPTRARRKPPTTTARRADLG